MKSLLIRADGGESIGAGHVMRCLALAEAWHDSGGQVSLATAALAPALEARVIKERVAVTHISAEPGGQEDALQTGLLARGDSAAWVVVDGYGFGHAYQDALRQTGLRVLLLDDLAGVDQYTADLILNPNPGAAESLYAGRDAHCSLLLGPAYALVRREFRDLRKSGRPIEGLARRILVTLGGSDPGRVTLPVIEGLRQADAPDLEVIVVAGPVNGRPDELEEAISRCRFAARLERNPANLPELMAWADIAVSAAGGTCWELAFLGVPALVLICAGNQRSLAGALHQAGAVENLGEASRLTPAGIAASVRDLLASLVRRERMRNCGRNLVDGRGAERVVRRLRLVVHFREVREQDCRLLWEWVNEPEVRAASFRSDPVAWVDHLHWFRNRRENPRAIDWIALDDDESPLGQVRFDVGSHGDALISVSVAASQRGKGYGSALIASAVQQLFRTHSVVRIDALIKTWNRPSLQAFERAGFRRVGSDIVNGQDAERFVCHKENAS